jgi:RNA polymerase sigma-70 factor (ECF subfamily)
MYLRHHFIPVSKQQMVCVTLAPTPPFGPLDFLWKELLPMVTTGTMASDTQASGGPQDREALNHLASLLYDDLRRLAVRQVRCGALSSTLSPTALVHEAYLRLATQAGLKVESGSHFVHIAAQVMRCVLVDRARARFAAKRGGNLPPVSLDLLEICSPVPDRQLLALDDALASLEKMDPQKSRLVELRFFAGLSVDEAAESLGISARTAAREWLVAKAWLYAEACRGGAANPAR